MVLCNQVMVKNVKKKRKTLVVVASRNKKSKDQYVKLLCYLLREASPEDLLRRIGFP